MSFTMTEDQPTVSSLIGVCLRPEGRRSHIFSLCRETLARSAGHASQGLLTLQKPNSLIIKSCSKCLKCLCFALRCDMTVSGCVTHGNVRWPARLPLSFCRLKWFAAQTSSHARVVDAATRDRRRVVATAASLDFGTALPVTVPISSDEQFSSVRMMFSWHTWVSTHGAASRC